jgi:hypothetical protein
MALNIPLPDNNRSGLFEGLVAGHKRQDERMRLLQAGLSGIAGEVQSLERLKNMLPGGEANPIYQQAKQAFELDQQRVQENIKSSEFYRKNPWRLYDPMTKQFQAQQMASQGKYPEGGQAYSSSEQAENAANEYEKKRYKENTPEFLQKQYEASQQIDETLKLIDPKKAFGYSGLTGQFELLKDRYEAQKNGNISEKYKDFEEQESYLHNLREQIRSYLGASITAGMTEDLDYLVNPSNWMNHPEIAKIKYNAVVKAYENEKKVTEKAIKHGNPSAPAPIFGVKNENLTLADLKKPISGATPTGMMKGVDSEGHEHNVHPDNKDLFIERGGKIYE